MKIKLIAIALLSYTITSCVSTKSTLKNVETTLPDPLLSKSNTFIITEFSKDKKYGYDKDYPINVFFRNTTNETINQQRFLNALTGPNGEKLSYAKKESCCPFPSKNNAMGAGMLDVYEVTWEGLKMPFLLYFNIYEKGLLMVPDGFGLKK